MIPLILLVTMAAQAMITAFALRFLARVYWNERFSFGYLVWKFLLIGVSSVIVRLCLGVAMEHLPVDFPMAVSWVSDAVAVWLALRYYLRLPGGERFSAKQSSSLIICYTAGWNLFLTHLVFPLILAGALVAR